MEYKFNEYEAPTFADLLEKKDLTKILEVMAELYEYLHGSLDMGDIETGYLKEDLFKLRISNISVESLERYKQDIISDILAIVKNIVEIIKPIMHHEEDENNIFIRESDNGTLLEVLLNQSNIISKLLCKEKD